jgi:hypothetical protein
MIQHSFYAPAHQSAKRRVGLVGKQRLQRLSGRTHEVAQGRDVGAVRTNAPGIYRQSEALGQVQIQPCVVQLRKAESRRRQHAIDSRGINRTGRTMALPRAAGQLVKLFPISLMPSSHCLVASKTCCQILVPPMIDTWCCNLWMQVPGLRFAFCFCFRRLWNTFYHRS